MESFLGHLSILALEISIGTTGANELNESKK